LLKRQEKFTTWVSEVERLDNTKLILPTVHALPALLPCPPRGGARQHSLPPPTCPPGKAKRGGQGCPDCLALKAIGGQGCKRGGQKGTWVLESMKQPS